MIPRSDTPRPTIPSLCLVLLLGLGPPAIQESATEPVLEVGDVVFGRARLGENPIEVRVRNRSDSAVVALLDLRAVPGMWMIPNMQAQFSRELAPGEEAVIEGTFEFLRLSPEATLRVTVGPGETMPEGYLWFRQVDFRETYDVGVDSPDAYDPGEYFTTVRRAPFEVYAWKGSIAEQRVETIAKERLEALTALEGLLGVAPPERIRLVLYPDEATKLEQTGHQGVGWARSDTLVEVYNDETRLDPYHELAHIVAGAAGSPPPILDEGLAIYAAERFGADALALLGGGNEPVDRVVCRLRGTTDSIPLAELLALDNIGSDADRATREYAEAGSFVRYLVESRGLERFREAYAALDEEAAAEDNAARLERIYEATLETLEEEWLAGTAAACEQAPMR